MQKFLDGFEQLSDSWEDWREYFFADRGSPYFTDLVEKTLRCNFWKYLGNPNHWSDKYN